MLDFGAPDCTRKAHAHAYRYAPTLFIGSLLMLVQPSCDKAKSWSVLADRAVLTRPWEAPISCETGIPENFSLVALDSMPAPLPQLAYRFMGEPLHSYNFIAPASKTRMRFQVCVDYFSGQAILKSMTLQLEAQEVQHFIVSSDSRIQGLTEALFGSPGSLLVESFSPRDGEESFTGIWVKGFEIDGASYIVAHDLYKSGSEPELNLPYAIVGRLEPSVDVFSSRSTRCKQNIDESLRQMKLGHVSLGVSACIYQAGGFSSIVDVVQVDVVDTSPWLTPAQRESQTISGADLEAKVRVTNAHHNWCDNLVVRLAHASYGFTSMTTDGEGCPTPLSGAPAREDGPMSGLAFKVTYEAAPDQNQEGILSGCSHFALAGDCEPLPDGQ